MGGPVSSREQHQEQQGQASRKRRPSESVDNPSVSPHVETCTFRGPLRSAGAEGGGPPLPGISKGSPWVSSNGYASPFSAGGPSPSPMGWRQQSKQRRTMYGAAPMRAEGPLIKVGALRQLSPDLLGKPVWICNTDGSLPSMKQQQQQQQQQAQEGRGTGPLPPFVRGILCSPQPPDLAPGVAAVAISLPPVAADEDSRGRQQILHAVRCLKYSVISK